MAPVPVDDPRWEQLRAAFPAAAVSKMPRGTCKACSDSQRKRCDVHQWVNRCSECGGNHSSATIHLDYVGHADVTDRLDVVDPHWTWEPAYRDVDPNLLAAAIATGLPEVVEILLANAPARYTDGGLWIRLTVLGVTRYGFGDAQGKSGPNAVKELIGDAIRNAAMRFGVATYLWSKSEAAQALREGPEEQPEQGSQEPAPEPQHARQARPRGAAKDERTKWQPPGPTDGQVATARALAFQAAKAASAASTTEALEQIADGLAKTTLPVDVAPVITPAQRTAAEPFDPRLAGAGQIPLWGWLATCRLFIEKNSMSVSDGAAYDEPEPAEPAPAATA